MGGQGKAKTRGCKMAKQKKMVVCQCVDGSSAVKTGDERRKGWVEEGIQVVTTLNFL